MKFSEAEGRKVVSTTNAETVGKVDDYIVDPARRSVVALELKKTGSGDTVRWSDIVGFGTDAVTVAGPEKITDAPADIEALSGKDHRLRGKRVLSADGDELGKVDDVEFDHESGEITGLVLDDSMVPGVRLIGVGSYAVVVATT